DQKQINRPRNLQFLIEYFVENFLDFISKNFVLLKHSHNLKLFDKISDNITAKIFFKTITKIMNRI
ncbi:hypothetical protein B6D02_12380, partial [Gilliamella apicola]|uniref:hypothetical protein n=1 Tax=Gilliamella apicola TaxID=1196095 RepID=UPI000B6505E9